MLFTTFITNLVYFGAVTEARFSSSDPGLQPPQIYIDGDIIIGGLFPVHHKGNGTPCGDLMESRGIHRVFAMLYALDRINHDNRILRGLRIGTRILDTCSQPNYALNMSLHLVKDVMIEGQSSQFSCPYDSFPPKLRVSPIPLIGVVGASYSSVSTMVANFFRLFEIVQVSPASTNPDLSDKSKYEYFARTVPSDVYQAQVLADIVAHFNWSYVSLIHSEGEYGRLGADRFKEAATLRNVCIALEAKIFDGVNMTEIVEKLRDKAYEKGSNHIGARAVVLFTRNDDTRSLLLEVKRQELKGIQWIAADGWETTTNQLIHSVEDVAGGALVVALAYSDLTGLVQYIKNFQPNSNIYPYDQNQWFLEWWEGRFNCALRPETLYSVYGRLCTAADRFGYDTEIFLDDKVEFVIDAVTALARSLNDMWTTKCGARNGDGGKGLCAELLSAGGSTLESGSEYYQDFLLNVTFNGISGRRFHFTSEGDGPSNYVVKTFRSLTRGYEVVGMWNHSTLHIFDNARIWEDAQGSIIKTPISRCAVDCQPGKRKVMHGGSTCCWICVDCPENAVLENEFKCAQCAHSFWPDSEKRYCYSIIEHHLEVIEWSSFYGVVPCILSGFGLLTTFIVVYLFVKHNHTPIVKASGRELSYTLLTGIATCYLVTFVILAKPSTFICTLRRIGIGLGFTMLYSALLVKTNRIYRIFDSARRSAMRPRFISPRSQIMITFLFVMVQIAGTCIWMGIVPPGTYHDYPAPQPQAVLKCNAENEWFLLSMAYDMILIIICTIYAVLTRMVPENFNEAKFIGFTMYTTCVIWLAFVPIYFGTGNDFRIQNMTLCISISLSATVALVLLYSPKIYVIFMEPEKNIRGNKPTLAPASAGSRNPSIYSPLLGQINNNSTQLSSPTPIYANKAAIANNAVAPVKQEVSADITPSLPAKSSTTPSIEFSGSGQSVAL